MWGKCKKFLKNSKGITVAEVLVSVAVLATFTTATVGTVIAGQRTSQSTDVAAFFDNRNQNAVAAFKTNPSPDYLKGQEPFASMTYDESSNTFEEAFDNRLKSVDETSPDAKYFAEYQLMQNAGSSEGFSVEGKEVSLELRSYKLDPTADSGRSLLQNSAAKGKVTVHTNTMEVPGLEPGGTVPDEKPEKKTYRVAFRLSGGTFGDTGNSSLVKVVGENKKISDVLPSENEYSSNESGAEFQGWKIAGTEVPVDSNDVVSSDLSITGTYKVAKNITVKFKIPKHAKNPVSASGDVEKMYTGQENSFVDPNGLAQLFGKSSQAELFPEVVGFKGWFDEDGNKFTVQADNGTPLTDIWNGKTLIAKLEPESIKVPNEPLASRIKISGKLYTNFDNSEVTFLEQNDKIYAQIKDVSQSVNLKSTSKNAQIIEMGEKLDFTSKIQDLAGDVNFTFEIDFDYSNVGGFFKEKSDYDLYYKNTPMDGESMNAVKDSSVKFSVSKEAEQQLAKILGVTGNFTLNLKQTPKEKPRKTIYTGQYASYLHLETVSQDGRKDNEEYQIKFVENPGVDSKGRKTYQIEIIGDDGKNIMDKNKENGKEWGNSLPVTKNIHFLHGGNNIEYIDKLTLCVFEDPGNFNIKFKENPSHPDSAIQVKEVKVIAPGKIASITRPQGSGNGGYLRMRGSSQGDKVYNFDWMRDEGQYKVYGGTKTWTEEWPELPAGYAIRKK